MTKKKKIEWAGYIIAVIGIVLAFNPDIYIPGGIYPGIGLIMVGAIITFVIAKRQA